MIRELWSNFWTLVGGALTLNGQVLLVARDAPRAYLAAVLLGVAAGISLALGQSVVLFANRVLAGEVRLFGPRRRADLPGPAGPVEPLHLAGGGRLAALRPPPGGHLPGGLLRPGPPAVRRLRDAPLLRVVAPPGVGRLLPDRRRRRAAVDAGPAGAPGLPRRRAGLAPAGVPGRPPGAPPGRGAGLDVADGLRARGLRPLPRRPGGAGRATAARRGRPRPTARVARGRCSTASNASPPPPPPGARS